MYKRGWASGSAIIEYIFQQQQLLLLHHLDDVLVSHHMGYADALGRVLGGGAPNQSVLELRCQCAMDGVANVFHTDALRRNIYFNYLYFILEIGICTFLKISPSSKSGGAPGFFV